MKRKYLISIAVLLLFTILGLYGLYFSPSSENANKSDPNGEEIAQRHCSTCHLFPEPNLLDKKTWTTSTLPEMGQRMGIKSVDYDPDEDVPQEQVEITRKLNIYPDTPMLAQKDWEAIVNYYAELAPDSLPVQESTTSVTDSPPPFQINEIDIEGKQVPQVTLLHYDDVRKELSIGDGKNLNILNQAGVLSANWILTSPAVDLDSDGSRNNYLLTIGQFKPSDMKLGTFWKFDGGSKQRNINQILMQLPRPVSFAIGDLKGDNKEDVIICGFGHHTGELAWYDDLQDKHVLSDLPGARKAIIRDLNGDMLPDIMVLMAQAWEGVDIYYNEGNGQFSKERILEFPAVHGVSYLELADFNGDGFEDLVITNGDNWDYSTVKKPYHGIRIYLNNGENEFEKNFFYPMYGCSKAVARDFDQDGDLDIAAISFYDNIDQPSQSFVYLENTGNLTFLAHYMPEAANGKWLTMEAGDFNQDGRPDLFLGSYFHNIGEWTKLLNKGITSFPEVLLLLNTSR